MLLFCGQNISSVDILFLWQTKNGIEKSEYDRLIQYLKFANDLFCKQTRLHISLYSETTAMIEASWSVYKSLGFNLRRNE